MPNTRIKFVGTFWSKPNEIHDLQDAECVDYEECDEPALLTIACRVPERVTLDEDRPKRNDYKKRKKREHKPGRKRRIERSVLHMPRLYHTLHTMRYLGVDYGSSKIGLALSDEEGTMGFPHDIIPNTPRLIDELCTLIAKENVGAVVIGESRTLAGGENPIAKDARAFGDELATRAGVPVFYESEVFTSAEARRASSPAEGGSASGGKGRKSRAPKARANVDASAAALILTSFLSRTNHGSH